MNFYFELSKEITYSFLIISFIWINASLLLNKKYLLLEKIIKNRYLCYFFRVIVIFAAAVFIDLSTTIKPIAIYTNWQVYVIFLNVIFLLSLPAIITLIIKKYI